MAADAAGTDGLTEGAGAANFDNFIDTSTAGKGFCCRAPLWGFFVVDQVIGA